MSLDERVGDLPCCIGQGRTMRCRRKKKKKKKKKKKAGHAGGIGARCPREVPPETHCP